jgi:hypothetical protein
LKGRCRICNGLPWQISFFIAGLLRHENRIYQAAPFEIRGFQDDSDNPLASRAAYTLMLKRARSSRRFATALLRAGGQAHVIFVLALLSVSCRCPAASTGPSQHRYPVLRKFQRFFDVALQQKY